LLKNNSLVLAGVLTFFFLMLQIEKGDCQLFSNSNRQNQNNQIDSQNPSDTLSKRQRKTNDSIAIHFYHWSDTTRLKLDSGITLLHRSPILSEWDIDLGNFASATHSVYFKPNLLPSNKLGIQSNQSFLSTIQKVKFYNTTRPYSNLYYRIGTKQEQIIEIMHSRNVNPNWNMTASYRKEGSPGSYKYQRTNNDHLMLSSNYSSKNQQYKLDAAILYNKVQQDENGGITDENYLYDLAYNNKRLVPVNFDQGPGVNRSSMTNYFRDLSINLKHQYYFGVKDSVLNADSSETYYTFKPVFGIKHVLYTTGSLFSFKDLTPDTTYYASLENFSFNSVDSAYSKYRYSQIGNAFSLTGNITFKKKIMQAEAGYGIEIDRVMNLFYRDRFINNYVFANIYKSAVQENEWLYNASLKFYFTGNLIGNTLLSAQAGRNFKNELGKFRIGFDQAIQNTPFMNEFYMSNIFSIQSNSKKQTISKLNFTYSNDKYNARAQLNYFLMANYIYWDTSLQSQQYDKVIPLTQVEIVKRLKYRRFAFDNTILLQFVSNNSPIHLPLFASSSRLAYENLILKKKLNMSTGFDIRFNSPYYTDQYAPVLYGFVSQYTRKISNFPRCSYFFNFKVKTFRASISFDELQQIFTRNNINTDLYPAQNFMMRFGFHWMFIN